MAETLSPPDQLQVSVDTILEPLFRSQRAQLERIIREALEQTRDTVTFTDLVPIVQRKIQTFVKTEDSNLQYLWKELNEISQDAAQIRICLIHFQIQMWREEQADKKALR